ncbi:MAG: inositol-3-phosphate synthase, partial [Candidatus Latescibacteria bacterium]|nr:inositol-3-phosphate synthase [Candidatus Latescibacterota bacterium]
AVRCCKLALDHGLVGALEEPSSYFMKTPPRQYTDPEAREMTEAFIQKHGKKGGETEMEKEKKA